MSKHDNETGKGGNRNSEPRQAMITTKTREEMIRMLEGRELELVARGPHQISDGTFVAHVIGTIEVLNELPKGIGEIEITPKSKLPKSRRKVGTGNRYLEEGSVPRGVGQKK